ncbi:MAG: STAS domain-containing protein [Clostridia bacterium]|nr:STAS domain-containing protein [Clostridia bacterium]
MVKEEKKFTYKIEDSVLEVKLRGEIDHHNAVNVRSDIDGLIFDLRPKKVVLDLSEISFMDSSGLGLIMGRYALIKDLGGTLSLRAPTVAVMKILSLAGMDRMVKIDKSIKEDGEK